jgi:hypothetical protein
MSWGCGPRTRPEPQRHSVDPPVVSNLISSRVTLRGEHLYGVVSATLDPGGRPRADERWQVSIGERELADGAVALVDPSALTAVVPAGLPTGVYRIDATGPDGRTASLDDALTIVAEPVGLAVSIEDRPGGAGRPVGDVMLQAGQELSLFAVLRGQDGQSAGDVAVTWTLDGGIGVLAPGPASATVLSSRLVGTAVVRADHGTANDGVTGTIAVSAAPPVALFIEDRPGGAGVSVDARPDLSCDDLLALHAVSRDAFGNFVAEPAVSWSVTGGIATVPGGLFSRQLVDLTRPGSGTVVIEHPVLGTAATGSLSVRAGRAALLQVSPGTLTRSADSAPVSFSVSARDRDGNATTDTGTIRWSVASGAISAIDALSGLFTPTAAGTGVVRAESSHGVAGDSGAITVTPGVAVALGVEPDTLVLSADDPPVAFSVIARDGKGNVTADVGTLSWSIASGGIGVIDASSGIFDPTVVGSGTVRAQSSYGLFDDSGAVTVAPGIAATLTVSPDRASTWPGGPDIAFSVTGVDRKGNATSDLGLITWSIASGPIAAIDPRTGLFTPTAEGKGTVRARSSHGIFDDSAATSVWPPVTRLFSDPFADGTGFAHVTAFAGQVYLGPSADGAGAVRFDPDGSAPESVELRFPADLVGNKHRNTSSPPYISLGRAGCGQDTPACGPDNEDGRGRFGAVTMGGEEWLIAGGARAGGDLDYVYLSPAAVAPLTFRFADLAVAMGAATKGFSALHGFGDRLYLGFPDTGGSRPYFLVLFSTPPYPGLDAVLGTDVVNLDADLMPGLKTGGVALIDAVTDFGGLLYLGNAGAWMRSTSSAPRPYGSHPGDWVAITPSAPAFAAKTSFLTTQTAELTPADRAVPQMASFGGRLYAGRNTTEGPQLWSCEPGRTGVAGACDGGDWQLVAANRSGDTLLTQFDNPGNTAISLVAATSQFLYVGFDNAGDGVVLFRTDRADAAAAVDFEGFAGCSAADHPGACAGLGQNGLGLSTNTRVLDGAVLRFGAEEALYLTTGDGAGPFSVYRMAP